MTDSKACQNPGCDLPGTMVCPTCDKLNLPTARFCKQECFKAAWKTHKSVHKEAQAKLKFKPPQFNYTGELRPHYVSPMRDVPKAIPKTDYYVGGQPISEMAVKGSSKIHINTEEQIKCIREACKVGREVLDFAHSLVKVGITTDEIDRQVHDEIIRREAYPSPLNYHHFPKSLCTSVNEVICHGIPDARPLEDGDIINLDITVYYKGFHGDLNETYCVGTVDPKYKKLIKTTYDSLDAAIQAVKPGVMCRDFGKIISKVVGREGYSVVRSYCGHGIGSLFHCSPNIPHYNRNKAVGVLKPGMIFTIEPMVNEGVWQDATWPDEWTSVTKDGKRSAQFEHTMLVTETGVEVLTARTAQSPPLWWEDKKVAEGKTEEKTSKKKRNKKKKRKTPPSGPLFADIDAGKTTGQTQFLSYDDDLCHEKPFPSMGKLEYLNLAEHPKPKPGQVRVVLLWGQYHKPGYKFLPLYSQLQAKYGDKVSVIGVSVDPDPSYPKKFLADPANKYSSVFSTKFAVAWDNGDLKKALIKLGGLATLSPPYAYVLNANGSVMWHQDHSELGATAPSYMGLMEQQIDAVLAGNALQKVGTRPVESEESEGEAAVDIDIGGGGDDGFDFL